MIQLSIDNFVKLVGSMDLIYVPDSFEAALEETKKRKKDTADKKLIPSGLT